MTADKVIGIGQKQLLVLLSYLGIGAHRLTRARKRRDFLQGHLADRRLKNEWFFGKDVGFIGSYKTIRTAQVRADLHQGFSCLVPAFPFSGVTDPVLIGRNYAPQKTLFWNFHNKTEAGTEQLSAKFRILKKLLTHTQPHDLRTNSLPAVAFQKNSLPAVAFQKALLFGSF